MTVVLTQNVLNYSWGKGYRGNHSTLSNGRWGVAVTQSGVSWNTSQKKSHSSWILVAEHELARLKEEHEQSPEEIKPVRYILLSPLYSWSNKELEKLGNFLNLCRMLGSMNSKIASLHIIQPPWEVETKIVGRLWKWLSGDCHVPFKATFPPEEAEDIVSCSHSTKLKTKLNEKPAISDAKVLDAFWEWNRLPSLLGPFIPLWCSPKLALIVGKKKQSFAVEERSYSNCSWFL